MVYSPNHGDTAFAVPLFDAFMRRIMPGNDCVINNRLVKLDKPQLAHARATIITCYNDGDSVARMTIRSTYSLDKKTSQRIKHLARTWHVSQAEAIRRSVQAAAEQTDETLSPADVVARYSEGAVARDRKQMRRAIESLHDLRHADDERRPAGTA